MGKLSGLPRERRPAEASAEAEATPSEAREVSDVWGCAMRTIAEWQKAVYELAVEKGWHSKACPECGAGQATSPHGCLECRGTGRVPVDPFAPTRIASRLALIHSEISEALECVAEGWMELYYCDPVVGCQNGTYVVTTRHPANMCHGDGPAKPEGFPIELADVFLRLCDLAESLGAELDSQRLASYGTPRSNPEQIAECLFFLHRQVSLVPILERDYAPERVALALNHILAALGRLACSTGVDLLAMAELKHAYNQTRPYRHGGKVL